MRNDEATGLVKGLGVFGATSVVAGTMIGTAIFVVPGIMLQLVRTPAMVLVVFVAAGVLSLFGALSYAELGAALPQAGGEFVYMHRAYGPLFGFLYGWTQFIIAKTASIAAIATGFVIYLAYFFPRLHETVWGAAFHFSRHGVEVRLTGLQIGSTLMVLLLSGLNILGVRRSGAVQTVFTASKLLVLAILIVLGLTYGHGSWQGFHPFFAAGGHGGLLTAFGVATVSALWAYDGWNNLSMVAGEVKNPQRNMPVALIAGALLVLIVYVLVNLAYFYVLPASQVLGTNTVASDAARRFLGNAGGAFIAVGVMISTFATLNGSILAGSRIPYATAREGLFPAGLGACKSPLPHTCRVPGMAGHYRGIVHADGRVPVALHEGDFFRIPLLRSLHCRSFCAAPAGAWPAATLSDLGISPGSRDFCYSLSLPAGEYILAATRRLHVGSRAGGQRHSRVLDLEGMETSFCMNRKSKLKIGNSKLETRKSKERQGGAYRVSIFEISSF